MPHHILPTIFCLLNVVSKWLLKITSLTKHIDELKILLAIYPLNVISINETRLDQGILNSEIYIPGYEIVRCDRNRNGGCVCFCIKTAINYSVRTDLNINNLENVCLEIRKPNSKPFLIVAWYRLPNSPNEVFPSLEILLDVLIPKMSNSI